MNNFLEKELEHILMRMPFWIDTKDFGSYSLWKKMYKCNRILKKLFVDKILTTDELFEVYFEFDIYFTRLGENRNDIEIAVYYATLLNEILEIVVYEEEYYVAANIQNIVVNHFKEIIFEL